MVVDDICPCITVVRPREELEGLMVTGAVPGPEQVVPLLINIFSTKLSNIKAQTWDHLNQPQLYITIIQPL